jgi:GNAT superfamily N-acetyltransferase
VRCGFIGAEADPVTVGEAITIRPAGPDDSEAIVAMAARLTAFERSLGPHESSRICRLTASDLAKHCFCERPLFHVLVAERDSDLFGYVLYCLVFDTELAAVGLWLGDVYVDPEVRGHGVGLAMLRAVAEACRAHDATWIAWQVQRNNIDAQRFYDRFAERDPDLVYWTELKDFRASLLF